MKHITKWIPGICLLVVGIVCIIVNQNSYTTWFETGDLHALQVFLLTSTVSDRIVLLVGIALIWTLILYKVKLYPKVLCIVIGVIYLTYILITPSSVGKHYVIENQTLRTYDLIACVRNDETNEETIYVNLNDAGTMYLGYQEINDIWYVTYADGNGLSTVPIQSELLDYTPEDITGFTIYKYSGIIARIRTD